MFLSVLDEMVVSPEGYTYKNMVILLSFLVFLLEPAPQGMGAPQSIETGNMTVIASLNPLPTTPPLPRSAQEHAGAVYTAPIPTSQIAN